MQWKQFRGKFHKSWHPYVKDFIESGACNKIYAKLKSSKKEIAPKSDFTFRSFEQDLNDINVVVMIEEPFTNKNGDMQYADGIPLSCEFVDKLHPQLNMFYNAMETEFYDLQLNMNKPTSLKYLIDQGVMFIHSDFTVEIDNPGSHNKLWVPFVKHLIRKVFSPKQIPIIFVGKNLFEIYANVLQPLDVYTIVPNSISKYDQGEIWESEDAFTKINKYLYDETRDKDEIMWLDLDVPY